MGKEEVGEAMAEKYEQEPLLDAGPASGMYSNKFIVLLVSLIMALVSATLFSVDYIISDGLSGPLAGPGASTLARACWAFAWVTLLGCLGFLGLGLFAWSVENSPALLEEYEPSYSELYTSTPGTITYVEKIKVRCRYCSTLNDVNAKNCVACGATL